MKVQIEPLVSESQLNSSGSPELVLLGHCGRRNYVSLNVVVSNLLSWLLFLLTTATNCEL
jgi:hypothetical protein